MQHRLFVPDLREAAGGPQRLFSNREGKRGREGEDTENRQDTADRFLRHRSFACRFMGLDGRNTGSADRILWQQGI